MLPVAGILMFAQDVDASAVSGRDVHFIMIFVGVIAGFFLLVLLGFLVAGVWALRVIARMNGLIDDVKSRADLVIAKATPLMEKTDALMTDLSPKIRSITSNVDEISYAARSKVDELGVTVSKINETVNEINRTVQDVNGRTRTHIARVDDMVAGALDTTAQVSQSVQEGIKAPVRHMAGLVAGLRVGMETFLEKQGLKRPKVQPNPYDL
jgi:methyl-accepting chemotaxis protein